MLMSYTKIISFLIPCHDVWENAEKFKKMLLPTNYRVILQDTETKGRKENWINIGQGDSGAEIPFQQNFSQPYGKLQYWDGPSVIFSWGKGIPMDASCSWKDLGWNNFLSHPVFQGNSQGGMTTNSHLFQ